MKTFNDGINAALAVIAEMQDGHLTPDLTNAYRKVESLKELAPVSLSAHKAKITGNASDWNAQDALNGALIKINECDDHVRSCVAIWSYVNNTGACKVHFTCSTSDDYATVGMIEHAKLIILSDE